MQSIFILRRQREGHLSSTGIRYTAIGKLVSVALREDRSFSPFRAIIILMKYIAQRVDLGK
jgi:hypothetical protein